MSRHWLVSFAVAKYGPERQVVKETNLFFALPTLLALLPEAPVVVLSRSPLGVASSFKRGDLFRRWDYRARYQQMITMTRHGTGDMRRLAPLVPDDDPPDLVALVRLQVLNTALIAAALDGRDLVHISYETSVTKPARALAALAAMLPDLGGQAPELSRQPGASPPADSTFATTNRKTDLTAAVTPAEAAVISATKTTSLVIARALLLPSAATATETWLSGDHLYQLQLPQAAKRRYQLPAAPRTPPPRWPG